MALRIKKQYKQQDGTIIEIEGTEAEIETYEKKQNKKNESAQRKKEILHGKAKKDLAKRIAKGDVIEELKKFLSEELQKLQAVREVHHWYYNNGWWWRPWYVGGTLTYLYSQTQPSSVYNGPVGSFYTSSDATNLSSKIGVAENDIKSKSATVSYTASNIQMNPNTSNFIIGTNKANGWYGTTTVGGTSVLTTTNTYDVNDNTVTNLMSSIDSNDSVN